MTTKEREDALALLMAAKLHLEEFGWRKGSPGDAEGTCCAVGAVCAVAPATLLPDTAYRALDAVTAGDIVEFNDTQRSLRPVLRKFDEAIALLEAGQ